MRLGAAGNGRLSTVGTPLFTDANSLFTSLPMICRTARGHHLAGGSKLKAGARQP